MTANWIALWSEPSGDSTSYVVVSHLVPIALLIFGIAIALLARRVELPKLVERFGAITVTLLGTLTGVFLITYIAWLEFGGTSADQTFAPEGTRAGVAYLVMFGLVVMLVGRTRWLARSAGKNLELTPIAQYR
jgi:hypothetical protein